jgi:hypothetical protein
MCAQDKHPIPEISALDVLPEGISFKLTLITDGRQDKDFTK